MKAILLCLLMPLTAQAGTERLDYTIDVFWHGHLEMTLQYQWRDTAWTTINRFYAKHHAMYVNSDELQFQINPKSAKPGWFMYGCVTDSELIITANDPRYCKAAREDFEN